jgi:ribosome maturation factor RimP
MISKDSVYQIIDSFLENSNYYLVDLKISEGNHIAVEIDCFEGVSIDFCVSLSNEIESKLDRNIEDYELEVSSSGLTEPFKVPNQYLKNIGNEVEVITNESKKITGLLKSYDSEKIVLEQEKKMKPEGSKKKIIMNQAIEIPLKNIKTTKYIFRFK